MKVNLKVYDERLFDLIDPEAEFITCTDKVAASEGPIWDYGKKRLLFSDHVMSKTYAWSEEKGLEELKDNGIHAVGMCYDLDGSIYVCEHATSTLSRLDDGEWNTHEVVFDKVDGHELNAPNDVIIRTDGLVYFSDPDFGRMDCPVGVARPNPYDDHYVVIGDPKTGETRVGAANFGEPNGLCFSQDEKLLYVNDTPTNEIWVFDVAEDGSLSNRRLFAKTERFSEADNGPDGMKIDELGNVWSSGPDGIHVYLPDGTYLGVVICGWAMNHAWGGEDGKDFFMTCGGAVYKTRTKVAGWTHVQYEQGIIPKRA